MTMRRIGSMILTLLLATWLLMWLSGCWAAQAQPSAFAAALPADRVAVIAHQGGNHLRPDNTMVAFEHAMALGVDVLEMDIHSSADGVLVVIHDDTVDRTTDGSGRVNDLTLSELKALDAGYRFTRDEGATFPYRGQGATIPTLEELFQAYPDMLMNIEIKQAEPSIAQPFCDLIHQYDKQDQVLIPSFSNEVMVAFREVCPDVATSAAEFEVRGLFFRHVAGLARSFAVDPQMTTLQIPQEALGLTLATPRFVRAVQARGLQVHFWTVNDSAEMQRLVDIGVDGIITDRPDLLLEIVGK